MRDRDALYHLAVIFWPIKCFKARIDEERRRKRADLNSRLPVSRLPPEVMIHIFRFIQHSLSPQSLISSRPWTAQSWIAVTHVCQLWRDIAVNCPSLWRDVSNHLGVKWLEKMIERTGETILFHVSAPSLPVDWSSAALLFSLLIQHQEQIERLSLQAPGLSPELCRALWSELCDLSRHFFPRMFSNLTALDIGHDVSGMIEYPAASVIPVLQRMRKLRLLSLRGFNIYPPIDQRERVAAFPVLNSFTLKSTIPGAQTLLCHLLIPYNASVNIRVSYMAEDSEAIKTLFHQVHNSAKLPTVIPGKPVRKHKMSRKMIVNDDTVIIYTSLRDGGPVNLSLRLERDSHAIDEEENFLWNRPPVFDAAMSLFASENLQKLEALSGVDWEVALQRRILQGIRAVEVADESGVDFCRTLLDSMKNFPSSERESRTNKQDIAQEIPFPKLTSLTLWSIDFKSGVSKAEDLPDILVTLIRRREEAGVHLSKLNLLRCTIPADFEKRLRKAYPEMVLKIEN
ncbi:hypothetical protein FA95DRAFT_1575203 [Auriscalpium vulgare]|uniref:Uncharacterized protein n=1 Tax=Auriscalpium vulgare TaxID=40419 RepID=A0ACB8RGP5_9AGAM|nr:hypothetical protein FA95DRAFT_1575203 [Auriscalpium vulgare]